MDFGDPNFDDLNETEDNAPPEEASNRTFMIIAGILGVIAVLVVVCIAVYFLIQQPRNTALRENQKATLDAQNTEVAQIVNQTATSDAMAAIIAAYTSTPTQTSIPKTPTQAPTATSVLAISTTESVPTNTLSPAQATATAFAAMRTSVVMTATANAKISPTATALGPYGFADEVGLPTLLGVSVLLIVVIFLARRLRTA
jgi:cytoskeletal protein RodZ